jgi:hypothetical protein
MVSLSTNPARPCIMPAAFGLGARVRPAMSKPTTLTECALSDLGVLQES